MSQNESFAAFQRSLDIRYNAFTVALKSTLSAFGAVSNLEVRKKANDKLRLAARDLHALLHQNDQPQWLNGILNASTAFHQAPNDERGIAFLEAVAKYFPSIQPIRPSDDKTPSLDFDELYLKYRDSGKLPELFDKLIELANKMIGSGEIESVTALEALKKLVETLKANRDGSFLAARQSVLLARYLKHLTDVVLEKVPILAELREAWDRTIDEADAEFKSVEQQLRDETLETIKEQLPRLDRLPDYKKQTVVFQNPPLLPAPNIPALLDKSQASTECSQAADEAK